MALRNQPYMPLYVQDYLTDEKLNMCSAASQGIFIKIMCQMHKSDEYGTILLKQKDKQNGSTYLNFACKLARLLPFEKDELKIAIQELVEEKVLNIDGDKLYQKRMIHDNNLSIIRAESGSKGGKKTQKDFAKAKIEASSENESEVEDKDKKIVEWQSLSDKLFKNAWDNYDKKEDRKRAWQIWEKFDEPTMRAIVKAIPIYVKSTPDKRYRKMFKTYLNNRSWENEIILPIKGKVQEVEWYVYSCYHCLEESFKKERGNYRCKKNDCQIEKKGDSVIGAKLSQSRVILKKE